MAPHVGRLAGCAGFLTGRGDAFWPWRAAAVGVELVMASITHLARGCRASVCSPGRGGHAARVVITSPSSLAPAAGSRDDLWGAAQSRSRPFFPFDEPLIRTRITGLLRMEAKLVSSVMIVPRPPLSWMEASTWSGAMSTSSTSAIKSATASSTSWIVSTSSRESDAACSVPSSATMSTFLNAAAFFRLLGSTALPREAHTRIATTITASSTTATANPIGPTDLPRTEKRGVAPTAPVSLPADRPSTGKGAIGVGGGDTSGGGEGLRGFGGGAACCVHDIVGSPLGCDPLARKRSVLPP
eukprot:CAMPEP_0181246416 /NCGR_PEP_ID=MMETSP1096-20121128/43988_1 /TAXON_ID=156174 ORGANISM="Chrysochromulina ericina, Strain CCMP281" /NCGR_SAMPLE_ID=MMETSP1096 /ASSEMBLY_ACC=CAM_ASM_000453 /LENGTH=298 /DNA_ID=CAMNT_0023343243 /DNA_START=240 /DNA_END=1133 /DNA_ORIENTATION=+